MNSTRKETELAAAALKVKLQYLAIGDPKYDIGTAFRTASKGRADAVLMMTSRVFVLQRTQITDLAAKSRIPAIVHGFDHHPIGTQPEIGLKGVPVPPLSRYLLDDQSTGCPGSSFVVVNTAMQPFEPPQRVVAA